MGEQFLKELKRKYWNQHDYGNPRKRYIENWNLAAHFTVAINNTVCTTIHSLRFNENNSWNRVNRLSFRFRYWWFGFVLNLHRRLIRCNPGLPSHSILSYRTSSGHRSLVIPTFCHLQFDFNLFSMFPLWPCLLIQWNWNWPNKR